MANNRDYYMTEKIDDSGVAPTRVYPSSAFSRQYEMPDIAPFVGNYLQGTSNKRYDQRLPSVEHLQEMGYTADEARAELQSGFNRLGNALVNNAVIAGTTAISGTIGLLYGAVDALANQELSRLYDNPVNRQMLEWQEAAAEAAPNYYKKGYQESSIWKKLGTSMFWADLIKNLGYTEGMMIPAMLTGGALAGTPAIIQKMGASLAGAVSEASIEALQAKRDKMSAEDRILVDEVNKLYTYARTPEERQYITEQYQQAISQIEDAANQAGNSVLGYNMALLTATNALEWGKLFTRGNKASRAALKAKERSAGIRPSEDGLSLDIEKPWVATAKNLGRRGYQAFVEGSEEVLQDVAVRAADLNPEYNSFNESIFNPEKRELADNSLQALGMAFSQAMKDPETATNFAMGFFTSVLGSPRFRAPREDGRWRSPLTMEGGVTEFMRERRDYNRRRAIVNDINTRMADPKFQEYYNGLVRDMDLTEKANQALEAGNEFNFQNYQFASMVSDVIMLDNVGQGKMLDDIINRASNMSDEEVQGLIDSGLFQQNGNPMSVVDAKQKIQENASKMKALSQQYREMKEYLEASKNGPEFSKDALENLIYAKMQIENWRERQKQITDEVAQMYKSLTSMMNEGDILSDDAIKLTATIPETREAIREAVNESPLTEDEKENWNSKLDDLDKIQKNITKFRQKVDEYYTSPQKANKEQDKIKKKAVEKDKKKRSDDAKTRLAEARSPRDFRRIYREIESEGKALSEDLERAANELDEEGNAVVKENRNIQSLYQGAVAKLAEMGLGTSEMSDATTMLRNAMEDADNFAQMAEPTNQMYTQMGRFYNDENPAGSDNGANVKRFFGAQAAAYKALSQQLKEMGKNAESARFTTKGASDPKKGTAGPATTGDSGVSPAPAANPTSSPEPVEVSAEDSIAGVYTGGIEENQNKQGLNETAHTMSAQAEEAKNQETVDPNRSWFPLSWFFIGARRRDGSLVPISDTEAIQKIDATVDFGQIPQWIERTGAQRYVDSGNLKVGDKIVIGVPVGLTDRNGKPVLALYKVEGDKKIPVGIFTASGELAKKTRDKILSAYEKADKSKNFFSDVTTTVNDVKAGYIQYGEQKSLSVLDPEGNSILAVVSNGSVVPVTGNSSNGLSSSSFKRPANISEKNGMVYVAIPNARKGMSGGYSLAGVRVKRFNQKEYPLDSHNDTPAVRAIRGAIDLIIDSKTQKDLTDAVKLLSLYLYMPSLNFYITKDNKVRVTITALDENGNKIKKKVKATDGTERIVDSERVYGTYSSAEELFNGLYALGPRFQIDKKFGTKTAILSDTLLVNTDSLESVGGWFTMNPVDEAGNEVKGTKIPYSNPTPKTTPASADNSLTVTVNGRQITLFSNGDYLSLATGQRKSPKDAAIAERYRVMYNLQKQYGDATEGATMWNNKAVVGDRVIDRSTGEWVTGAAADEVRNHVNPKPAPTSTTKKRIPKDSILVTRTHNGLESVFGKGNTLEERAGDIRNSPNGWGKNEQGLVYYKKSVSGREGDNVTAWFEEELSERDKRIVESIMNAPVRDDTKFNDLDYIKGTPQRVESFDAIFQNHDDMNPVEDLSENSKLPEGKVGYYFDSRDKRIHKTYMVPGGEILGTPVQVIKIPVMTSGLSSKGPKKLVGYNYGIVLPNGQSYIGTNINETEFPVNAVFNGIKASFEGPGSGPKGQEFAEEHKKEFEELKSMPSVFPEQSSDPINEIMNEVATEEQAVPAGAEMDGMSFEDFAASMGANIGGVRLREEHGQTSTWNREKELRWLNKILPNVPVEVREGILHIAGKNAWGMFDRAGITLSNVAASGTAYHEAFHAVFSLGLTGTERVDLVREAMKESGLTDPVEVEEWLAERFREYVMNQQTKPVGQKIKDFFKRLWNLIRGIREASPMRYSIYKRIVSGRYRNLRATPQAEVVTVFRPEEYTPEMMDILSTAKYDKEGRLLASNGQPSNLNERQWVHVRTKAFKEWFGDWENDPKNASKVIDENGEPLIVYHGSEADFTKFDYKYFGQTDPGDNGRGFYFAYEERVAKHYGDIVKSYFLNIKNPFIHTGIETQSTVKGFNREYNPTNREILENRIDNIRRRIRLDKDALLESDDEFHQSILTKRISHNELMLRELLQDLDTKSQEELDKRLWDTLDDYDGVMEADPHYQIVVRNDTQIKSATDNIGTYSSNPDTRLRKVQEDNLIFLENGYSEEWVRNSTPDEKRIARYCIGI